ncbi:MAG: SsrA-binding protein SmpB [Bdellovibrionota bacterium]
MAKTSTRPIAIKIVTENKKARFDYSIGETFEAGLELRGSEVKSLRAGDAQLKDSYIVFKSGEAFLQNAHIAVYKASSYNNHEPERLRKLLLKETELMKIDRAIQEKGLSCVPLKIYFKGGWAKLEIALVKGKKASDKRESLKSRDADRELAKAKRKDR